MDFLKSFILEYDPNFERDNFSEGSEMQNVKISYVKPVGKDSEFWHLYQEIPLSEAISASHLAAKNYIKKTVVSQISQSKKDLDIADLLDENYWA